MSDHLKYLLKDPKLRAEIGAGLERTMRLRCPEGLKPVIYRRNHERWAPGFLIERLAKGGYRVLSQDLAYRVHRLRAGAEVIEIAQSVHAGLMAQYKDLQAGCLAAIKKGARVQ